MAERKIIHIDMDAFFASVEQRDKPTLIGQPTAVGGRPEQRGVVATASYEARRFGIHSAMPMATALRKCPHLRIIKPRIAYYRQIAEQIRDIFLRFTDTIEPLSIDEAYLDVSNSDDYRGSATLIAQQILQTIYSETQLTASAGVSYCKFLAKYASNINKPNGIFTIVPSEALAIIAEMPVGKFHGIGPATEKKLHQLGIYYGWQLREADMTALRRLLGKSADFYHRLSQGIDYREVQPNRVRKSVGNETTFQENITDKTRLQAIALELTAQTWQSLEKRALLAATMTLKVKYADFSLQTKSHTQTAPIYSIASAEIVINALLEQVVIKQPIRLLGVTFSHLVDRHAYPLQRRLFD